MASWDINDRPNRFPWPPVLLILTIALGFGLQQMFAFGPGRTGAGMVAGLALIALALMLDVWASFTFTRARTTILPHRGSAALVSSGPFRFSRNPIYLGNLMILTGVGFVAGSLWHIVLVPILALAVFHLAIKREEAHLRARFPQDWADYSASVRRWI